jgi:hypothetical protein
LRLSLSLDVAEAMTRSWQGPLGSCQQDDLLDTVEVLGRIQREREVLLVRVLTELHTRGVESPGGLSRPDWLRAVDPTLTAAAAKAVVTVAATAAAVADPSPFEDAAAAARRAAYQALLARVRDGSVPVGHAAQVIDLGQRLNAVADPDELTDTIEHLTAQAGTLRPEELARACRSHADQLRPPRDLQDLDDARRRARGLWFSAPNQSGMVNLKAVLDPESAAIVKGAIDPLAAPRPLLDEDTRTVIEPDPRPAHHRRADALGEIISRGVAAPHGQPRTDKAKIVVTIDYDTLAAKLTHHMNAPYGTRPTHPTSGSNGTNPTGEAGAGPGTGQRPGPRAGFGVSGTGEVLSPTTVRRLACDASLIAAVLGRDSAPLDIARKRRLVTPAIRTALILRDQGCSFPGCTMPAAWTDAHHLTHWIDGGPTSLANLTLLCRRHHTHVHRHDLTATITPTTVTWHTWQQWRRDRRRRTRANPDPDPQAQTPTQTRPPDRRADNRQRGTPTPASPPDPAHAGPSHYPTSGARKPASQR